VNSKATHGFSSQLLNYSFNDNEQFSGKTVYYRLKLISYGGQEAYSEVRVMRNAGKLQTLIYPNPSAGNLQIVLPQYTGANTIELTDYSGKIIRVWKKYNAPVLNISNLPKGLFTFVITNLQTAERTVEKIIVQ
jgi:Secretion system C-terminal sorting domain